MQHPAPVLALILYGWVEGGGGGRTGDRMIKDLKNLAVTCLGWGQYKMYKSIIIIINFISWSKKLKPKMLSCVWSWCSVNKLLILWQFVMSSHTIFGSVGDKAQDTQNFWSFCIRGQQGLILYNIFYMKFDSTHRLSLLCLHA